MDSELILAESWRQCVTVFSSQKNRYHKFLGASRIFDLLEIGNFEMAAFLQITY